MKKIENIINDRDLEPFFLDYIRCSEESCDLPEKISKDMTPEEVKNIMIKADRADIAFTNLIDEINTNYGTEFDADKIEEDEVIVNILNRTCEHYIDSHSLDKIMSRPLEFIDYDEPYLSDLIGENGINICEKCNSIKKELKYDELPEEIKEEYRTLKDSVECYLFCKACNEYAIISPN